MSRSRILLTLALAAILATPCVYGAPREERTRPAGLVEQFWGFLTSAWAEIGMNIDPHGANRTGQGEVGSLAPDPDLGHGIDPHGEPAPEADLGFGLDPHG